MSINTSMLKIAANAVASGMTYEIIKGTDATAHHYQSLFAPQPHQSPIPPDRGYYA